MPYDELSYEQLYERLSSENPRRSISYKRIKDYFFVVTGNYAGKSFYTRMHRMPGSTRGVTITWSPNLSPGIDGIVLALADSVFDLDADSAPPSGSGPLTTEDDVWIVVASRIDRSTAIVLAREYAERFKHTEVFRTRNGRFAITIGAGSRAVAQEVLDKLLLAGAIPDDSYLSTGTSFMEREWDAEAYAAAPATPSETSPANPPRETKEPSFYGGTGFFVTSDGVMITNAHVAGECEKIEVPNYGTADLIHIDRTNDLAAIKVINGPPVTVAILQVLPLRIGSDVVVLGYPLANILGSALNVTSGQVSSLSGVGGDTRYFQLTAPIQPGNSGGPVLDLTGRVVGVASARLDDLKVVENSGALPQNVNFAIRAEVLRAFLRTAKIEFAAEASNNTVPRPDVAESGAKFTAHIICTSSQ